MVDFDKYTTFKHVENIKISNSFYINIATSTCFQSLKKMEEDPMEEKEEDTDSDDEQQSKYVLYDRDEKPDYQFSGDPLTDSEEEESEEDDDEPLEET